MIVTLKLKNRTTFLKAKFSIRRSVRRRKNGRNFGTKMTGNLLRIISNDTFLFLSPTNLSIAKNLLLFYNGSKIFSLIAIKFEVCLILFTSVYSIKINLLTSRWLSFNYYIVLLILPYHNSIFIQQIIAINDLFLSFYVGFYKYLSFKCFV